MGIKNFFLRVFTWWNGQTFGTQLFTWRSGEKVGEDAQGNIYYKNSDDSRRWVIFNGEVEASHIAPDWRGWLHRMYDDTPEDKPLEHKAWEKPNLPNLTGTDMAYAPDGSLRSATSQPKRDYEAWVPE